jgi:hypothetical protein
MTQSEETITKMADLFAVFGTVFFMLAEKRF